MRLRPPEWVLLSFFAYIVVLSGFFPNRPNLHYQPALLLMAIAALFLLLALLQRGPLPVAVRIARDWLPLPLTFVAFREMELFLPKIYNLRLETLWIRWDRLMLHDWHGRALIEAWGWPLPLYFEVCYFLVYGISSVGVGILAARDDRRSIDRYWTIYLAGTLTAYALFPYFPSQPPRYAFPAVEPPTVLTWVRHLNLWLLSGATIHSAVFPSAHVSSAFSSAWALFLLLPRQRTIAWLMLLYAVSVAIATIYGRYHYAADVVAGFGVSLIAAAVCLWFWWREKSRYRSASPRHVGY